MSTAETQGALDAIAAAQCHKTVHEIADDVGYDRKTTEKLK